MSIWNRRLRLTATEEFVLPADVHSSEVAKTLTDALQCSDNVEGASDVRVMSDEEGQIVVYFTRPATHTDLEDA